MNTYILPTVLMFIMLLLGAAALYALLFTGKKGRGPGLPANFETERQPNSALADKTWAAHIAAGELDRACMVGQPQEILDALDDAAAAAQELVVEIQLLKDKA